MINAVELVAFLSVLALPCFFRRSVYSPHTYPETHLPICWAHLCLADTAAFMYCCKTFFDSNSKFQVTKRKYLYDVEANRPFLPSHHVENLASKIGCIVDINEDDRINKQFYDMALKKVKVCYWNFIHLLKLFK